MKTLRPSTNPLRAIEKAAYEGQDPKRRMYRFGYEEYMANMPVLSDDDLSGLETSHRVMDDLAIELNQTLWATLSDVPAGQFARTILAIERGGTGKEIIVAHWGNGFTSPVHGHAEGLIHEILLTGMMRVNIYRLIHDNIVRLVRTDIFKDKNELVFMYAKHNPNNQFQRQTLIHSFTSIGQSTSLHYVPEHTRDGRDNQFEVEYFPAPSLVDVKQITGRDGMYLRKGDVALVRSTNVPEYGDHYIVVTGAPVQKEHGLRVRDIAITAPNAHEVLDAHEMINGLTLLKLNNPVDFLSFHDIKIVEGEVVFPDPLKQLA